MAQYVAVRALNRSSNIRLVNSDGVKVKLTTTNDVIVDLDEPTNRRELARHNAIGQYIVTAANSNDAGAALPANA